MNGIVTSIDPQTALQRLLADSNAVEPAGRMQMARSIEESLRSGRPADDTSVALLRLLADDPKWEIRKIVADALVFLDDNDFQQLVVRLSVDSNWFVKNSALRGIDRRRKVHRQASRQQRAVQQMADQLDQVRRQHGEQVAQKAMELGERRYNLLAGAIAHDLRSILTHLKSNALGLATAVSNGADAAGLKGKCKAVAESVEFLERCVADIESYSQSLPVDRHPEDLLEVLQVARDLAVKNLTEVGHDISPVALTMDAPEGVRIRIARHLIVLALANLIKNGIQSFMTGDGDMVAGTVEVRAEADVDEVRISIRDSGMGMSEDDLRELRAMVPVRRNKAKRKSTGFGLPIANRYVAAHGGALSIESKEDDGTCVIVTLPRGADVADEA
jgi:signal transduction histidine kinase